MSADDSSGSGEKPSDDALVKKASDILLPEVLAAVKQEGAKVDVNVLLVQITEKSQSPAELVEYSEKALEIARKFEDHRVETFKKISSAVIEVKKCDPDEIEKRKNNGMRRILKGVIALCGIGCVGGAIVVGTAAGSLLLTVILGTAGTMCFAMLGPLASGESVSSNDMVRMFSAWATIFRTPKAEPDEREHRRKKR